MQNFNPLIDERNPFYCPELPAAVYLKSLRSKVHANPPQRRPSLARSFARVLEQTFHEDGDLDRD
ncbi:hypothetical protein GALMADRAFT_244079 [Galerina marginata CBS 339.88]|uniref:Uncharacterized protein n=1 Tax=Galerina marginata (strain CBS 339.88) TaxID=685588 RepID=A0A067T660_GALM3|nr:hypothetical protein GALMADRAFT_244079 [Galerina marginata CBS 339.88]